MSNAQSRNDDILPDLSTRVLVAEDDSAMRELIVSMLAHDGYEVVEARDGAQVLHHIGALMSEGRISDPPDLIITDVRMPGMTGLEILRSMRRADWRTPFIVMTAFGDAATHAEARRWGAAAVLDKPFELHLLRRMVHDLLPPLA
jgi:CheY-like chemotaxis protein